MKKILIVLIILCYFLNVDAIIKPSNAFYVNDSASILTNETKEYIIQKSTNLNQYRGAQIVVVTIPNLDGMSIERYATTLFNNWGIGDKDKNNGLLIIISLEERKSRIEVGSGLERIFTNEKTGIYQDKYLTPYLENQQWDKGIISIYDVLYNELEAYISDTANNNNVCINISDDNILFLMLYYFVEMIFATYVGYSIYKNKKYNIFKIVALIISNIPCFILIYKYNYCLKTLDMLLIDSGFILLGYTTFNKKLVRLLAEILPPISGRSSRNGSNSSYGNGGHSSGGGSSKNF